MLTIKIDGHDAEELFDEVTNEFIPQPAMKPQTLQLEHSLIAISKWESKWCKPFFLRNEKTSEETLDYIRCMTINQNVDSRVYRYLTDSDIEKIKKYIDSPMTATKIYEREQQGRINRETITSELVYYWMVAHHIPHEYEKWHINRLITLIRICNIKNTPPKKRSKREILSQNAAINEARRKKYNTKG